MRHASPAVFFDPALFSFERPDARIPFVILPRIWYSFSPKKRLLSNNATMNMEETPCASKESF